MYQIKSKCINISVLESPMVGSIAILMEQCTLQVKHVKKVLQKEGLLEGGAFEEVRMIRNGNTIVVDTHFKQDEYLNDVIRIE